MLPLHLVLYDFYQLIKLLHSLHLDHCAILHRDVDVLPNAA